MPRSWSCPGKLSLGRKELPARGPQTSKYANMQISDIYRESLRMFVKVLKGERKESPDPGPALRGSP